MKSPFSKSSIVDTVVNVGLGGAANAAMDYAVANVDALSTLSEQTVNIVKIVAGAVCGTMIKGKYAKYTRPAFDGIATVGAANLIKSYIDESAGSNTGDEKGTSGASFIGKTGRYRRYRGTGTVPFMA